VVVGSLNFASWSYCVPGKLEPFSTMLLLGSTDSTSSLQSVPSVYVAIVSGMVHTGVEVHRIDLEMSRLVE